MGTAGWEKGCGARVESDKPSSTLNSQAEKIGVSELPVPDQQCGGNV